MSGIFYRPQHPQRFPKVQQAAAPPGGGDIAYVGSFDNGGNNPTTGDWDVTGITDDGYLGIFWLYARAGVWTANDPVSGLTTELHSSNGSNGTLFVLYRWLTASDTIFTWTRNTGSSNADVIWGVDVFSGAVGSGNPFSDTTGASPVLGTSADPDPDAVTPADADSAIWAIGGKRDDSGGVFNAPTDYILATGREEIGGTDASVGTIYRLGVAASSQDPGPIDLGTPSLEWSAWTAAIIPAAVGGSTVERTTTDSLGLADAVTRVGTFIRAIAQSLTLADVVARVQTLARAIAQGLTLADAVTRIGTFLRAPADSINLADAVVRVKSTSRTTADALGLSDAVTRLGTFLRTNDYGITLIGNGVEKGLDPASGTWTVPTGTVDDDWVLVWLIAPAVGWSITLPLSGFTEIGSGDLGDLYVVVAWKRYDVADGSSYGWTRSGHPTNPPVFWGIEVYRGVALAGNPVTGPNTNTGTAADPDPAAVTPAVTDSMVWALAGKRSESDNIFGAPTDYSLILTSSIDYGGGFDGSVASIVRFNRPTTSQDPGVIDLGTISDSYVTVTAAVAPELGSGDGITLADVVTSVRLKVRTVVDALSLADTVTRTGTFLRATADAITLSDAATRIGTFVRATIDGISTSTKPAQRSSSSYSAEAANRFQSLWTGIIYCSPVWYSPTDDLVNVTEAGAAASSFNAIGIPSPTTPVTKERFVHRFVDDGDRFESFATYDPDPTGSIFIRVKPSSLDSVVRFFGLADSFEARADASGFLYNDLFQAGGTSASSGAYDTSQFHNIIFTWSDSAGTVTREIYLNGTQVLSETGATSDPGTGTLHIGNRNGSADADSFLGDLSTFYLWHRVLTANERAALFEDPWGMMRLATPLAQKSLLRSVADAIGLTDAATRTGTFLRAIADSITLADVVVRLKLVVRTAVDVLSLADTVARIGTFLRTVADALTLADVATRIKTVVRTTVDALGLSDSVARVGTFLRSISDAITLSDVAVGIRVLLRSTADALNLSDAVTRTGTFLRSITQGLTLADAVTRTGTFLRSIVDAITLSDAAVRLKVVLRSTTDALSLSDAVTRIGTFLRAVSDALSLADVATRIKTSVRTTTDALVLSDAATRIGTFLRAPADAINLADVATRTLTLFRSVSDGLNLSDVATRIKTSVRTATDALSLSDAVTRVVTLLRNVTDSITLSDAVVALRVILRSTSDALNLSDAATRTVSLFRAAADALSLSDAVTRTGTFIRSVSDAITLSDVVTGIRVILRSTVDSLNLSDAATRIGTFLRNVTDAITLSDVATRIKTSVRSATDALNLSDVATRTVSLLRNTQDAIVLSDTATRLLSALRATSDAIGLSDVATRVGTFLRNVVDSVSFTDTVVAVQQVIYRFATDALTLADSATRQITAIRTAVDSISLSDTVARVTNAFRSAVDSISLTDTAAAVSMIIRSAVDSLGLTDVATRTVSLFRSITDSISLSDVATQFKNTMRSASDSIGLTDTAERVVTAVRSATDAINLSDLAERAVTLLRSVADSISFSDIVSAVLVRPYEAIKPYVLKATGFLGQVGNQERIGRVTEDGVRRLRDTAKRFRGGKPPNRLG